MMVPVKITSHYLNIIFTLLDIIFLSLLWAMFLEVLHKDYLNWTLSPLVVLSLKLILAMLCLGLKCSKYSISRKINQRNKYCKQNHIIFYYNDWFSYLLLSFYFAIYYLLSECLKVSPISFSKLSNNFSTFTIIHKTKITRLIEIFEEKNKTKNKLGWAWPRSCQTSIWT